MKLVEEVGEVVEVLNRRSGRKEGIGFERGTCQRTGWYHLLHRRNRSY